MEAEGQIGPASYQDGSVQNIRMGKIGDYIISGLHPRYYTQAYRGNVFSFANQGAVTTQAVATTTAVATLTLSNNLNSGKNLALMQVAWAFSTSAAAISCVSLCGNVSPSTNVVHTTPGVIQAGILGGGAPGVGKVDTTATLPVAPVVLLPIVSAGTSALGPYTAVIDVGGSIIIPPGAYVTIAANATAVGLGAMIWEEMAI